jgi:hypothetical protein
MRDGTADIRPDSVREAGLAAVEATLAGGVPFGRYRYIAEQVAAVYTDLLILVAGDSAAAKGLLARIDGMSRESRTAVFRDCLLRRTIEDGVCRILMDIDTIEPTMLDDLLTAAASAAVAGNRTLLNEDERGACLGPTPDFGYVWVGDQTNALPGRRFMEEILKRVPRFRIHAATQDQVDTLVRGARLASQAAPNLASSALSHIFMVVLGDFEAEDHLFNSFTLPGLPGVLILSPDALSSDTAAAEALFHEAFHLKFLDIDYIHPLFTAGFRQETSPRITPVWHENDPGRGDWPIDRVLTSMHVYLALAVFLEKAASAEDVRDWEDGAARAAQCRTRATWLFDTAQDYLDYLTDSGRQFVASIGAMLAGLNAAQ